MGFAFGFVPSMAVSAALDLGVFDAIDSGSRTLQAIASATSASQRGLQPLLHTLASLGLLEVQGDQYQLASDTELFLLKKSPAYLGGVLVHQTRMVAEWAKLAETVRQGKPNHAIEGDEDEGEFFAAFVDGLFNLNWPAAQAVAAQLPATASQALDVGCGSAVWSLALAQRAPQLQTVAVDRAVVLERVTRPFTERLGCADRYEYRAGNFRAIPFEEEHYDVAFLGHILHSEGRAASHTLLQRLCKALKPGGTLVIAEMVAGQPRESDVFSNLFDLNMLIWTEDGTVFDSSELEEMCRAAGFSETSWVHGPSAYPLLLARR